MEEGRRKVLEALDDILDQGIGEFRVKVMEDNNLLISVEYWIKNPSETEVEEAVQGRKDSFRFGSVEVSDGKVVLLKVIKKFKV